MASTLELLRRLASHHVDFVLVGGMAAIVHGSASVTEDVDVCVRFDEPTLRRIWAALEGSHPRQRMNPARPALGDPAAFVGARNLYVVTDDGIIDFLGEILAVGGYDQVSARALTFELAGFQCRVIGIEDLVACKRALGRPKDLRVVLELEAVLRALGR